MMMTDIQYTTSCYDHQAAMSSPLSGLLRQPECVCACYKNEAAVACCLCVRVRDSAVNVRCASLSLFDKIKKKKQNKLTTQLI